MRRAGTFPFAGFLASLNLDVKFLRRLNLFIRILHEKKEFIVLTL